MNLSKMKGNLLLLLTALIWGSSFVSQSIGMDSVEPFTFNGIRTLLGGIVLLPVILITNKQKRETEPSSDKKSGSRKDLILGGICCGTVLCIASNFQQFGIVYTTAGKSGFITALYVVLVPLISFIVFRKRIAPRLWVGVLIAVIGLYLLCVTAGSFSLGKGDFLTMICALFFAFHILAIDYFSPKVNGVQLSCLQFFVSGILSLVCMYLFETPDLSMIKLALPAILYSGVMSCGVAYTLQIIGQKYTDPTVASILMCLESVFAVLSGWLILHETLSLREAAGCLLMFSAIILTQLPDKKTAHSNSGQ